MRFGPATDSDLDSAILGGGKDAGKEDEGSACNAIISGRDRRLETKYALPIQPVEMSRDGGRVWDNTPQYPSDAVFKAQRLLRRARGPDRQLDALYQVNDPAAFAMVFYCRQRLSSEGYRAIRRFGMPAEANGEVRKVS